jgi:16S rRNA C967 or C1407 C5-methylase (RsmB/RsmF family)
VVDAEGAAQARASTERLGLRAGPARGFTPLADGCDGFFVARLEKAG